ncbi:MAG: hypothetical protein NZ942_00450 [Candidatus Aenigmarchaeota archaeon]|nr:hypothetical protein [Candidatus Aenigmarchaeota archaeon]
MEVIRKVEIELVRDRKMLKWRVNWIANNKIRGFLKPASRLP